MERLKKEALPMKKALSLALILILSSFTLNCAFAVKVGDYLWQGQTITVTAVDPNPMFSPADMTEDEYAVAVTLQVPDALAQNEELINALYAQAKLVDGIGTAYPTEVSMIKGSQLTYLYAIPIGAIADALTLQFIDAVESSIPEEYIGDWEGSVNDIHLTFTVNPDGTGSYTFEQSGYTESYDFTMEVSTGTFSLKIPEDNLLKIVSCEGTYQYADGVLTLDVLTTFSTGRQYMYTVPCRKAEPEDAADTVNDSAALTTVAGGTITL
jgi:hypothetical protein